MSRLTTSRILWVRPPEALLLRMDGFDDPLQAGGPKLGRPAAAPPAMGTLDIQLWLHLEMAKDD